MKLQQWFYVVFYSAVIIGRDNEIEPYKEETDTVLAETDKVIARQVKSSYEKYDLTYCNLNGFRRCLNEKLDEDAIKVSNICQSDLTMSNIITVLLVSCLHLVGTNSVHPYGIPCV